SLVDLVHVAGQRWKVEEAFQASKGLTGLDEHQVVRRWTSWHRWATLTMLAHAFLAITTAAERSAPTMPHGGGAPAATGRPSGPARRLSAASVRGGRGAAQGPAGVR